MPCDSNRLPEQTVAQRMAELRSASARIAALLAAQKVQVKVDKRTGAIAFVGISDRDRSRMTDNCIYRRIMSTGSFAAKQEIAKAERLAGRAVDKKVVASGVHSHDGGQTWHPRG